MVNTPSTAADLGEDRARVVTKNLEKNVQKRSGGFIEFENTLKEAMGNQQKNVKVKLNISDKTFKDMTSEQRNNLDSLLKKYQNVIEAKDIDQTIKRLGVANKLQNLVGDFQKLLKKASDEKKTDIKVTIQDKILENLTNEQIETLNNVVGDYHHVMDTKNFEQTIQRLHVENSLRKADAADTKPMRDSRTPVTLSPSRPATHKSENNQPKKAGLFSSMSAAVKKVTSWFGRKAA